MSASQHQNRYNLVASFPPDEVDAFIKVLEINPEDALIQGVGDTLEVSHVAELAKTGGVCEEGTEIVTELDPIALDPFEVFLRGVHEVKAEYRRDESGGLVITSGVQARLATGLHLPDNLLGLSRSSGLDHREYTLPVLKLLVGNLAVPRKQKSHDMMNFVLCSICNRILSQDY